MIDRDLMLARAAWCAVLLVALPAAAVAQGAPQYNVRPECNFTQSVIPSPESQNVCLKEERDAHAKLEQNWASYPSSDREECVGESSSGGSPSYVDLLTCLEMTKDARALQRQKEQGRRGQIARVR